MSGTIRASWTCIAPHGETVEPGEAGAASGAAATAASDAAAGPESPAGILVTTRGIYEAINKQIESPRRGSAADG